MEDKRCIVSIQFSLGLKLENLRRQGYLICIVGHLSLQSDVSNESLARVGY